MQFCLSSLTKDLSFITQKKAHIRFHVHAIFIHSEGYAPLNGAASTRGLHRLKDLHRVVA